MPNMRVRMASMRVSLSQITSIPTIQVSVTTADKINQDDAGKTEVKRDVCNHDNEDGDEDKEDSGFPEIQDYWGLDHILSKFTKDDQKGDSWADSDAT